MEFDLVLKKEDSLPTSLQARDNGVLILPEGYRYCSECDAITPHNTINEKWRIIYECKICNITSSSFSNNCPNCGWEEPEPCEPLSTDITIHNPGCHHKSEVIDQSKMNEDGLFNMTSWADYIADRFYESWMQSAPDKDGGNILPRDREWYDKNKHLKKRWDEMKNMKCGCPTYRIYNDPHVINYSYRYYASMDCMNAVEWNYDIRCPICGEIFHVWDSNC